MFCTQCGRKQASEALFCQFCGQKLPVLTSNFDSSNPEMASQPIHPSAPRRQTGSGALTLGIAGLVLGILGITNAIINFGILAAGQFSSVPLDSAGLVFLVCTLSSLFSGVALAKGSGSGIVGLILGSLGISLSLLLLSLYTF